jgi:hypothetical protein
MSARSESTQQILRGVGYAASLVAPLLLLLDLSANFPEDWSNHLWMIGYYGDYFRQHGDLPTVMNIAPAVGLAQPVFYAWLFYPLLGVVAAATGAALALRLAIFAMVAIQFFALIFAGRKILGQTRVTYVVAVSVIWATYSLTNLYNRGALAEYFATGFFVTAIAFGAMAVAAKVASSRWFYSWVAGVFLVLTAGTHAPTAVLAAAFLALLAAGGVIAWRRSHPKMPTGTWAGLASGTLAGAVILSPWVYACGLFASKLSVTRGDRDFIFRPDNCDSFWGRFAPFPYDASAIEDGINELGTRYLEAPISIVLLGILLWNIELCRRSRAQSSARVSASSAPGVILVIATGWFLFLATLSLSPWLAGCFGFFAPYIQYVYRLVSHCNAALLVAVFASGLLVARREGYRQHRQQTNLVLAVCLTVAILGLGIKLEHAAVVSRPAGDRPASAARRRMEVVPAYTLPGLLRELTGDEVRESSALSFPVGQGGAQFGEPGAARIELKQAGWVRTNVVVFPWMKVVSDGKELRADQRAQTEHFLAIYLPAGRHELRPVWQPDRTWSILRRLSQATFVLVGLVTLAWAVARWFARHASPTERGEAPA